MGYPCLVGTSSDAGRGHIINDYTLVPKYPPFLVRPICPSLGALCPSLWGLAPASWPLPWGCPGLYWSSGPGCRGGPRGGMSSGMPEAPYISGVCDSPDGPLDVLVVQVSSRAVRGAVSLPQFNRQRMNDGRQKKRKRAQRESPRPLWMK